MSKDYRMSLANEIETALTNKFSADQIGIISNIVIKALNDYEITERCTDIAPIDNTNERLIKRYRACLMVDGKSEKTIYQYTRTLVRLSEAIPKPFTEMTVYDIRYYLAMEQERGISARSRENLRANLSAFYQWMVNDEIIPKNPIDKLAPIKYKDEERQPFSDVEVDAIRGACKTLRERAIVEMLLSTGVRVSELASMSVSDINLSDLSVHVVHGKGNKERITYTTGVSLKHLLQYLNNRQETGQRLFYNRLHEPLGCNGIRLILNGIAERAGVNNVHPHRFRRTFATTLAKRGMSIHEIQRLLGHTNINTTMTYIAMNNSQIQSSYKKYIA